MTKLRVFEAFSGYGSQSLALEYLGIPHEVVAISEVDKYAIQGYEALHGKANNLGDISKINVEDIPEHDLFTYSFPCQDISIAGRGLSLEESECLRLMGLHESEIEKLKASGLSNTRLYKLAGNSIVVNVLESIFSQLFKE